MVSDLARVNNVTLKWIPDHSEIDEIGVYLKIIRMWTRWFSRTSYEALVGHEMTNRRVTFQNRAIMFAVERWLCGPLLGFMY